MWNYVYMDFAIATNQYFLWWKRKWRRMAGLRRRRMIIEAVGVGLPAICVMAWNEDLCVSVIRAH